MDDVIAISGDDFSMKGSCFLTLGSRPLSGEEIQFYLNGLPFSAPFTTDDSGRVIGVDLVLSTKSASTSVETQLVGTALSARTTVALPRPKKEKKIAEALDVQITEGGVYFFVHLTALDDKHSGIPKAKINIFRQGRAPEVVEANDDGIALWQPDINDRGKVKFQVVGTDVSSEKELRATTSKQPMLRRIVYGAIEKVRGW